MLMEDEGYLEERVVTEFSRAGLTLATAESCTGGLIAHRITNVPGASAVFLGGIVAYANHVKTQVLEVPEALIAAQGAVCEDVAVAMARGACARIRADYAIAVTGIAGPDGGTPEKPVGTVYMAVVGPTTGRARHFVFDGDRDTVKKKTAEAALLLLIEVLEAE